MFKPKDKVIHKESKQIFEVVEITNLGFLLDDGCEWSTEVFDKAET